MSKVYGPVALTTGVTTFQDVGVGAPWVVIENSSLAIDLGVSFQVNDPGPVAQFSGSNAWAGVVQAGGSKRFALPSNDGQWTGRVWLFPLSVATLSAATGTSSGYSRAYITVFGQNEQPLDFQGVIRGLDLTSQPRIVTINAPTLNWVNVISTTPLGTGGSVDVTNSTQLSAANLSNGRVNIYFSYIYFALTQPGACVLDLQVQFKDATHTIVGAPFTLQTMALGNPGRGAPGQVYNPILPTPLCYSALLTGIPTATEFVLVIKLRSGDGQIGYIANVHFEPDLNNKQPIADTGNAVLHLSPSSLY